VKPRGFGGHRAIFRLSRGVSIEVTAGIIRIVMNTLLLDLLATGAVIAGIFVITSRNPILSVLGLIAVFVNVACYLVLLGMSFIGLTYLILYVGAIAILFLFVVMMINLKLVELEGVKGINNRLIPLGVILSGFLLVSVGLFSVVDILPLLVKFFDVINLSVIHPNINYLLGKSLLNSGVDFGWDSTFNTVGQIVSLGILIYTTYGMMIVMLAFILLLAIIGPIVITFKPSKPLHNSSDETSVTPHGSLYRATDPLGIVGTFGTPHNYRCLGIVR
jgi:NADH-ubiquinone oxidoreductase chain 6